VRALPSGWRRRCPRPVSRAQAPGVVAPPPAREPPPPRVAPARPVGGRRGRPAALLAAPSTWDQTVLHQPPVCRKSRIAHLPENRFSVVSAGQKRHLLARRVALSLAVQSDPAAFERLRRGRRLTLRPEPGLPAP